MLTHQEMRHYATTTVTLNQDLQGANRRLAALATTDALTNLPNHRALSERLDQEVERAQRYGHPLSLLFFDGDRFKQVNDTYGHAIGDAVLRELGSRATSILRAGDI
ncbi:MAG: GGDEF domain-containing protein, partial [Ktedonobacteraceae bacterium]|nr:GGDEF domain-containing protein [Ktedonobacteraceae bacterium]